MTAPCMSPGCTETVEEPGQVCPECLAAFGDYLRPAATVGPPVSVEDIESRNQEIRDAYAQMLATPTPQQRAVRPPAKPAGVDEPERKRNQICWLCTDRKTCTRQQFGWECDECLKVT